MRHVTNQAQNYSHRAARVSESRTCVDSTRSYVCSDTTPPSFPPKGHMPTSESKVKASHEAGYKPAELWKPRPLFRMVPPPLATGGGENKVVIMKRKISVDTYPHQCSFHHRTWCLAKLGVVMDDNLRVRLAVR